MTKPLHITKEKPSFKSMDFSFLKEEGIRLVQQLAGDNWTDYNPHDPGVTILEQLCYALTDLGYRTNFELEDLLTANLKLDEVIDDNAFFAPDLIFPTNPVSITDYRKLIIDQVHYVKNAWLVPVRDHLQGIVGLYRILLQVDDEIDELHEKEEVKEEVTKLFHKHRNLCEGLEDVQVLEMEQIGISAEVEISSRDMPEQVLAGILHVLSQTLNPSIRLRTLEELLDEGYTMDKAFDGPMPKHGFIVEEDLKPLSREVHISKLAKMISNVDGVRNVTKLKVRKGGFIVTGDVIRFEDNQFPVLDLESNLAITGQFPFQFTRAGAPVEVDLDATFQILSTLNVIRDGSHVLDFDFVDINKVKSKITDPLEGYSSIQHHFPSVYGIDKNGVAASAAPLRKAQAKQLKAYLLFFEQIMADYLAQLSNIRYLFSLDDGNDRSYFSQVPRDIPHLSELLSVGIDELGKYLDETGNNTNHSEKRRNRFITHLLARFGETFVPQSLFGQEVSGSRINGKAKELRSAKIRFLKEYPELGQNRAKGYNHTEKKSEHNFAGLEKKLCHLLGLEYEGFQSISGQLEEEQLWMKLKAIKTNDNDKTIPAEVEADFIQYGVKPANYEIVRADEEKKRAYEVYYVSKNQNSRIKVYKGSERRKCNRAIEKLAKYLEKLNQRTEGFHLVEHILLRPQSADRFAFNVIDDHNEILLESLDFTDRTVMRFIIEDLLIFGIVGKNYSVFKNEDDFYQVGLKTNEGRQVAISKRLFEEEEKAKDEISFFINYFNRLRQEGIPVSTRVEYLTHYKKGFDVEGDFYSLRLSLLFPSWSVRLNNHESREAIADFVTQNIPSHLDLRIFWLDVEEMMDFENLYVDWKLMMADPEKNKEVLDGISLQIVHFFQNLEKKLEETTNQNNKPLQIL
ncbi:MAG: hypothetical protein AAF502_23390 [Bacteroidota bacterium]